MDQDSKHPREMQKTNPNDWAPYALASVISLESGFRETGRRIAKQARELSSGLSSEERRVANAVCDSILSFERRRYQRAQLLRDLVYSSMNDLSPEQTERVHEIMNRVTVLIKAT